MTAQLCDPEAMAIRDLMRAVDEIARLRKEDPEALRSIQTHCRVQIRRAASQLGMKIVEREHA